MTEWREREEGRRAGMEGHVVRYSIVFCVPIDALPMDSVQASRRDVWTDLKTLGRTSARRAAGMQEWRTGRGRRIETVAD